MASTHRIDMAPDSPSQRYLTEFPRVASFDLVPWAPSSHPPSPRNLDDAAQVSPSSYVQPRPFTSSPGKITRTPPPPRQSASHDERPLSTRSASLPKLSLHGTSLTSHSFISDHQVSTPRLPLYPEPQSRRKSTSSLSPVSPATSGPPPPLPSPYYSLGSTPQSLTYQPRSPLPERIAGASNRRSFSATAGPTSMLGAKYDVKRMMSKPAPHSSSSKCTDDPLLDKRPPRQRDGDVPPSPFHREPAETDKPYFSPPTRKSSLGPPSNQSKTSLSTSSEILLPSSPGHVDADPAAAPKTLTPASAIVFAYQQSQLRRPSPSPNPSFSSFSSKQSVDASISADQSCENYSASENSFIIIPAPAKPFASLNYKTSVSRLVAVGSPSDSSHHVEKSSPTSARADSAFKSLRRKVSGKLRRTPKVSDSEMFERVMPSTNLTPPLPTHPTGIPPDLNSPATWGSGNSYEGGSWPSTPGLDPEGANREDDRGRLPNKAKQPHEAHKPPAKLKKRASRGDALVEDNSNSSGAPAATSGSGGLSFWKLVKKFSSSTLKEKHNSYDNAPPVPPVPKHIPPSRRSSMSDDYGVVQSTSSRLAGGMTDDHLRRAYQRQDDSSQSSASHGATKGQPGSGPKSNGARSRAGTAASSVYTQSSAGASGGVTPAVPSRSPLHSRPSTVATSYLSSSPKSSSDMASSKFFARTNPGSPRTSTSSYVNEPYDVDPPPMPNKSFHPQYILPPSEIYQNISRIHSAANPINVEADESASPHRPSRDKRRLGQSDIPLTNGLGASNTTLATPITTRARKPSGASEHTPIGTPTRSHEPLHRSRSKSREREYRPPTPPSGTKSKRTRKISTLTLDNEATTASASAVSSRYVAVQDDPGMPSYDGLNHVPGRFEISSIGNKANAVDQNRYMAKAKSRPDFSDTYNKESPVLFGPMSTFYPNTPNVSGTAKSTKRRSRSQSPGARWSIDDPQGKRDSSGSAKRIPFARAYSIDSPGARAAAAAASAAVAQVAFRELKAAASMPRKTDEEKARMWDMLMEKSEMAGGTLKATVDSSY